MAFFQHEDGSKTPLPSQNIDTGAGLERLIWVVQNQRSVYETDVFSPILARVGELTDKRYGEDETTDRAMRVVAEHGRAVTFLIGDGVPAGQRGAGLRAAAGASAGGVLRGDAGAGPPLPGGRSGGGDRPDGARLPGDRAGRGTSSGGWSGWRSSASGRRFTGAWRCWTRRSRGWQATRLRGADVFKLYDTYGLPRELTAEIAAGHGLAIDDAGYERAMEEQRTRARKRARFTLKEEGAAYGDLAISETRSVGYERLSVETTLAGIIGGGGRGGDGGAGGRNRTVPGGDAVLRGGRRPGGRYGRDRRA